jgi:hypothetical protein
MDTQERDGAAGYPAAADRDEPLVPILVDYFTRDGSTLMMRLLATSPQIVVGEPYPFERKYFAYLFRWARLLDRRDWPKGSWTGQSLGSLVQEERAAFLGPPPWLPRELMQPPGGEPAMSEYSFDMVWREFSRRARAHSGDRADVRYYAEKHMDTRKVDLSQLPPVKVIVLLRDPRDTYVSIRSFDRKRRDAGHKGPAMWGVDAKSREERLAWFIDRQRDRMRWIVELLRSDEIPVVRYEDLVGDLPGVAGRLESWLGVSLDPSPVAKDKKMRSAHVSAASPESSVGRWRRELPRWLVRKFSDEIGDEMGELGFEVPRLPADAPGPRGAAAGAKE